MMTDSTKDEAFVRCAFTYSLLKIILYNQDFVDNSDSLVCTSKYIANGTEIMWAHYSFILLPLPRKKRGKKIVKEKYHRKLYYHPTKLLSCKPKQAIKWIIYAHSLIPPRCTASTCLICFYPLSLSRWESLP